MVWLSAAGLLLCSFYGVVIGSGVAALFFFILDGPDGPDGLICLFICRGSGKG